MCCCGKLTPQHFRGLQSLYVQLRAAQGLLSGSNWPIWVADGQTRCYTNSCGSGRGVSVSLKNLAMRVKMQNKCKPPLETPPTQPELQGPSHFHHTWLATLSSSTTHIKHTYVTHTTLLPDADDGSTQSFETSGSTRPMCITSQKTCTISNITVKTSNFTVNFSLGIQGSTLVFQHSHMVMFHKMLDSASSLYQIQSFTSIICQPCRCWGQTVKQQQEH